MRGEQRVRLLGYPDPIAGSLCEEKDYAVPLCWLVPSSALTRCGRSLGHNPGTQGVCAL